MYDEVYVNKIIPSMNLNNYFTNLCKIIR